MYKLQKKRFVSERPTTDERLLSSREKAHPCFVLTRPDGVQVFSSDLLDLAPHVPSEESFLRKEIMGLTLDQYQ